MRRAATWPALRAKVRTRSKLLAIVVALMTILTVMAGFTPPAHAAPTAGQSSAHVEARVHFKKGEADYAAGNYADALTAYQAGYEAQPLPGFLVNIAQCQRRLGDLSRARATYQKFVMVAPDSPLVPEVRKLVEDLDRLLAEAEAAERAQGPDPASAVPVKSGSNETMDLEGADTQATGAASSTMPPSFRAPTPPPERSNHVNPTTAQASADSSGGGRRWWLWGGIAAVVVAGAATAAILLSRGDGATTIHDGSLGTVRR